ncbi:MAG: glycogen/starch synthase [Clostridia bacterium]|nr:glycogen/starch synthase [Clostridia bacterium]
MKVLFIGSEATPFVKLGGLADVLGTLPRALKRLDVETALMLPMYSAIPEEFRQRAVEVARFSVKLNWRSQDCVLRKLRHGSLDVFFIDSEFYFFRPYVYSNAYEDAERFSFFCKAALDAVEHTGFSPDILHCNDWHTGMIPMLHKLRYAHSPAYASLKTIFSIHNLRYQGVFDLDFVRDVFELDDSLLTPDGIEYYGGASFMKAGILYCDYITTVSPTYAQEILCPEKGEGLDGLLQCRRNRLRGILNGIDRRDFSPASDDALPANYKLTARGNKAMCKDKLQEELGLPQSPDTPLLGIVSRLTPQKGFELLMQSVDAFAASNCQLAVLGTGHTQIEEFFRGLAAKHGDRCAYISDYSDPLARRIYAGADMFLMPSQTEPCGISQLIAMRYGTPPIVHETGGLHDSVKPYNRYTGEGTGFTFSRFCADDMCGAINRALECYWDKRAWNKVVRNAMRANFGWKASAKRYADLYKALVNA